MEFLIVTQAAEKWGISTRRLLCANGEIDGVTCQKRRTKKDNASD